MTLVKTDSHHSEPVLGAWCSPQRGLRRTPGAIWPPDALHVMPARPAGAFASPWAGNPSSEVSGGRHIAGRLGGRRGERAEYLCFR
jgi:hypothetical protein